MSVCMWSGVDFRFSKQNFLKNNMKHIKFNMHMQENGY